MKKRILFLLVSFLIWLPLLAIQKPVFMLYQESLSATSTLSDFFKVIAHGLLLDCTMAGYFTVIPLLCILISTWFPGKGYRRFLTIYTVLIALFVSAIFAVDVALYGYWGFRIDSTLFFYLQSPKEAMASVPVGQFIVQFLVFLAYFGLIFFTIRKWIIPLFPDTHVKHRFAGSLAIILLGGILFIPIRGGVTTSTANVGMVYFSNNQFLNHSAINPCFSLLTSFSKQQDFSSQFRFFPEDECKTIFSELLPDSITNCKNDNDSKLKTDRPNILIILMESFSANAVGVTGGDSTITPKLNSLSKEGILFTNLYANSFRTDRGIVSALNGYLAQPTTSIMKYPSKSQTLPALARSLDEAGYTSDMLYGGDINFTNMQSYFFSAGYSRITADRDFPLTSRLSKWGANDDITFRYLYEDISKRDTKQPWMTTFLTLSSHEPFEVPYNRLSDPYPNSVAFTDSCLGDFIQKFKKLPAWENTLIILVSDHGYRYPEDVNDYEPRRFHIPMLWLGGAVKKPEIISQLGNQTDLAATLLNELHLPYQEYKFSRNLFCPDYKPYAFYTYPNGFGFIDSTGITVFDNEGLKPLIALPEADNEERIRKGKALLQTLYDDLDKR